MSTSTGWYDLSVRSNQISSGSTSSWSSSGSGSSIVSTSTLLSGESDTLLCGLLPSTTVGIPTGWVVVGVVFEVLRENVSRSFNGVYDAHVRLVEYSHTGEYVATGTDQADTSSWPSSSGGAHGGVTPTYYGSSTSLMGLSVINPSGSNPNRYQFEIQAVGGVYASQIAKIAAVRCKFYYALPCSLVCTVDMYDAEDGSAPIEAVVAGETVWVNGDISASCMVILSLSDGYHLTIYWGDGDITEPDDQLFSPTYNFSFSHEYLNSGSYPWSCVTCFNYHELGSGEPREICCTETGEVDVTSACSPTCSPTASPTFGATPLGVTFTGTHNTPGGCGPYTYAWDFDDPASGVNNTSTLQSPTHTYSTDGSYHATFTVTGAGVGNTCMANTVPIAVSGGCAVACSVSPSVSVGNAPLTVVFSSTVTKTASCSGSATYFWDFDDGGTSTLASPTHVFNVGTYHWTLVVVVDSVACGTGGTIQVNPSGDCLVIITFPYHDEVLTDNTFTGAWAGAGGVAPLKYIYQLDSLAPVDTGIGAGNTSAVFSGIADGLHTLIVTMVDSLNAECVSAPCHFSISGGGVSSTTIKLFAHADDAEEYEWAFGDGSATESTTHDIYGPGAHEIYHLYGARGIYTAAVAASFGECPPAVDTVVVDLSAFSTDFTFSPALKEVGFTPTSLGGLDPGIYASTPRYYLFDFGDNADIYGTTDGYYYLSSDVSPGLTHSFSAFGEYDVNIIAVEGGYVDVFTGAGQTVLTTDNPFVSGTAVVLMGPDEDSLALLSGGLISYGADYEEGPTDDDVTLAVGVPAGYMVRVGYVLENTPAYSFVAVKSHVVDVTDAGSLNIALSHSSGDYCYDQIGSIGQYNFQLLASWDIGGVAPYTFTWELDKDCAFDGADENGYVVKVGDDIIDCITPVVSDDHANGVIGPVSYNPPIGTVGSYKTTRVGVSVVDDNGWTGSTEITLNFVPMPLAEAAGINYYAGNEYRFQSHNTSGTVPALGPMYIVQNAPQLGTPAASGVAYEWIPSTYLNGLPDSATSAMPTVTLLPSMNSHNHIVVASQSEAPYCSGTSMVTVIKPTITLQKVEDDLTWDGIETCFRRIILTISSVNPLSDWLALVVERVQGSSGAVGILGAAGASLPNILDRAAYSQCDDYYRIGGDPSAPYGGICLLDSQHWALDGGNNRITMKMSNAQPTPFTICAYDPICVTAASTEHDYRVRVIDISNSPDTDITETAILAQYTQYGEPIYSVSISNDATVIFNHSGLNSCGASLMILPSSVSLPQVGAPWNKTVNLSAAYTGFTPTSYTWSYDKLVQFNNAGANAGYSYVVYGDDTATPIVTYRDSMATSASSKVGRVGLVCYGTLPGGAAVSVTAGNVDYTISYTPACALTCGAITVNSTTGDIGDTFNFSVEDAVPANCVSASVNYVWDFKDGTFDGGLTVSKVYSIPGTYEVSVTATVVGGVQSCTEYQTIIVSGVCTIVSSTATLAPSSVQSGGAVLLSGEMQTSDAVGCIGVTTATWQWNCPGASPAIRTGIANIVGITASVPSWIFVTAGAVGEDTDYEWTLVWTLGNGETSSVTRDVTVLAGCSCTMSPSVASNGWKDEAIAFAATVYPATCSGDTPTIVWNFGDDTSATGASTTHAYAAPGTYYWNVNASYSGTVLCQGSGVVVVCGLSCSITNTSAVENSPVIFYSGASAGGSGCTGMTYAWDFGDGHTSTVARPTHTYTGDADYIVSLTVSLSGHSSTCTKTVSVAPSSTPLVLASSSFSLCTGISGGIEVFFTIAEANITGGTAPCLMTCTVTGGAAQTITYTASTLTLSAQGIGATGQTGTYIITVSDSTGQSVSSGSRSYTLTPGSCGCV